MQLLVTPFILTYKNDPRFAALCQKLKIPVPEVVGPEAMTGKPPFFAELKRRDAYKILFLFVTALFTLQG